MASSKEQFVANIYHAAKKAGLTDSAARVMAAQGALESGWGKSKLASNYNNIFGVKAGKSWKGATTNMKTREVYNGKSVTENATWRAYDSVDEAIADRVSFMESRFPAFNQAATVGDALDALQNGVYGKYYTDSRTIYERNVNSINVKYLGGTPAPAESIPPGSAGANSTKQLQQQLASAGFNPGGIDGIKGPKTTAAVKAFQAANGLVVDGIVGPKTLAALSQVSSGAGNPFPAPAPNRPSTLLSIGGVSVIPIASTPFPAPPPTTRLGQAILPKLTMAATPFPVDPPSGRYKVTDPLSGVTATVTQIGGFASGLSSFYNSLTQAHKALSFGTTAAGYSTSWANNNNPAFVGTAVTPTLEWMEPYFPNRPNPFGPAYAPVPAPAVEPVDITVTGPGFQPPPSTPKVAPTVGVTASGYVFEQDGTGKWQQVGKLDTGLTPSQMYNVANGKPAGDKNPASSGFNPKTGSGGSLTDSKGASNNPGPTGSPFW